MAFEKKIITDFPYEVTVTENVWIPLADGTRLSARIWMPQTGDPVPAILEYIPYRKNDGTRMRDEPMHAYFAGSGYAAVRVDMRGSGESDGLLKDEYLKQEQDDALEVIDWISRQRWCTGAVGMMGKSWGGFNSLQVAARRPPALRAIITVGFTDDRYNDDIHYKGGCLLNDNFWWGSIMLAYQCRPGEEKILGEGWRDQWIRHLENMPHWTKTWMEHPLRDDYWKHGSVCEDYSDIQVPVFAIDGWQDAYTNPVFTLMNGLSVPRKAIIGPWAHVYAHDGAPAPAMNFLGEAVRWWDRWLKDIENGADNAPLITAWLEDFSKPDAVRLESPGRWVGLDSWPDPAVSMAPCRLEENRRLNINLSNPGKAFIGTPDPAAGSLSEPDSTDTTVSGSHDRTEPSVTVCTPPNHGLLMGEWMGAGVPGESASDQRIDDGLAESFETAPLSEDLELLGFPLLRASFTCDKEKAMLFVRLSDIAPDGAAERVSYGVLNLTHREGHEKTVPLIPGEKTRADVRLDCCGHRFAKGHRIRVSLATTCWPMFWPMPESAAVTLNLNETELLLPVFTGKDTPGPDMQAQSAPLTPHTILETGRVDRSISYDIVSDTWTCITDGSGGVFGEGIYRFDEIDLTVEHNLKRELTLSNKDPLSADYKIIQKMKMGREGWITDTDLVTELKGDRENFILTAVMDAKENGKQVFYKEWNEVIPRNGL